MKLGFLELPADERRLYIEQVTKAGRLRLLCRPLLLTQFGC
jgi:hypothetical protein